MRKLTKKQDGGTTQPASVKTYADPVSKLGNKVYKKPSSVGKDTMSDMSKIADKIIASKVQTKKNGGSIKKKK
jgi:hypothetical protein